MRVPAMGERLDFNEGGNLVGEADGPTFTNNWRIRSNVSANWEKGDLGATWNVRYCSSQEETCQAFEDYGYGFICTDTDRTIAVPVDANNSGVWDGEAGGDAFDQRDAAESHIASTTYHDVSVYLNVPWNAKVAVGVNNVFDREHRTRRGRLPTRSIRRTKYQDDSSICGIRRSSDRRAVRSKERRAPARLFCAACRGGA